MVVRRLTLVDVSALIYAGYYVSNDDSKDIEETIKFPIAGARYAIRRIVGLTGYTDDIIAVMDSKTDKNAIDPMYKSNREHKADIHIQKEYLKYLLPNIGIKVACQDNYEADDLIYSIIYSLGYDDYESITIVTDDSDISGAIINDKIIRTGATSKTPTLDMNNYTALVKNGKFVPYNSVLAYHFFHGKPSNNIPSLKNAGLLFEKFINFAEENKVNAASMSNQTTLLHFTKHMLNSGEIDGDTVHEWISRCKLIYPKLDGLKYSDIPANKVNSDVASTHLSMLRETTALTKLNVARKAPSTIALNNFDKFVSMYRSGASLVDADITADNSFMFTSEFDSDNVRGF